MSVLDKRMIEFEEQRIGRDKTTTINHAYINSNKYRRVEKKVIYSELTKKTIKKYTNLLTIHSHPDSFPPSIDDLNSNFDHGYVECAMMEACICILQMSG